MNRSSAVSSARFDLAGVLPRGRVALEASAGTGKTYSLTGLLVRYIAEASVSVDSMLVVTFTRAAANELRDRTRETLGLARDAIASGITPDHHSWMAVLHPGVGADAELERRLRRLDDALARFDELAITTIHGFCQQALAQLGLRSGANPDAVLVESLRAVVAEVCRDTIVSELADDPTALNTTKSIKLITNPRQAEAELIADVTAVMANPGARLVPVDDGRDGIAALAARWAGLARSTYAAVDRRQRLRGEVGYDSLITGMHDALNHPIHGHAVARQLASRFEVVLVDEFQDTDRHQWAIFERAFGASTLVTVGDPKQAIYRFRGADVHAYLDAVRGVPQRHLDRNHRSDRRVLAGLAQLFEGATLGDERIAFAPVTPADTAPDTALHRRSAGGDLGAAIEVRVVAPSEGLQTKGGRDLAMPHVRSLILDDLVAEIVGLLDGVSIDTARGPRPVQTGDIAILVPSHAEANNVAERLRRARIPAVRTRTGSVLFTPAAEQWRLLLAALAQPHHGPTVRAAALGWFMATDVIDLDGSDSTLARLQEDAATMADRMRSAGLSAFYDECKANSQLLHVVLARQGGDRELTDLDHVAELLADAMHGLASEPGRVLRVLDEMITTSDERGEAAMRRIDSDAEAVQITTIHAAKGLEFPIVLAPFSFKQRGVARTPYSYIDVGIDVGIDFAARTLDLASCVPWDGGLRRDGDETSRANQDARRQWSIADADGDELRLLYVALTRAKHRVVVWWALTQGATTSALARVLLDRYGAGPVQNSPVLFEPKQRGGFKVTAPLYQRSTVEQAAAQIATLARDSDGTISVVDVPDPVEAPVWSGRAPAVTSGLAIAATNGRHPVLDRSWQRWSFSRIGSTVESLAIGADATHSPLPPGAAAEPAESGGLDEPARPDDDLLTIDDTVTSAQQMAFGLGPPVLLAEVGAGTRFGTFVHGVLEQLDFASSDLDADLAVLVAERARRDALDIDAAQVVAGLAAAVRTPLGPLFNGMSLTSIPSPDRLAELTFDFAISNRISAGAIGDTLLATLHPSDRLRPYAARLAGELRSLDISGWMHGSIDAVFRVPDDESDHPFRYLIVDYKTNRLHRPGSDDPLAAYHPTHLTEAMEHSRYPLQALLYSVALHRYLRWRVGKAYVPHEQLGGIGYLFLRGMAGPATPHIHGVPYGVFAWRPPTATILELDKLFGGKAHA